MMVCKGGVIDSAYRVTKSKRESSMTKSMTAFARTQQSLDEGELIWEIRSVNQRFLEVYFKMPEDFRASEPMFP